MVLEYQSWHRFFWVHFAVVSLEFIENFRSEIVYSLLKIGPPLQGSESYEEWGHMNQKKFNFVFIITFAKINI